MRTLSDPFLASWDVLLYFPCEVSKEYFAIGALLMLFSCAYFMPYFVCLALLS